MFKSIQTIAFLLAIIIAPSVAHSAGVEFHGLKSGMTKNDVIQYLQIEKLMSHNKEKLMSHNKHKYSMLYRDKNDKQILDDLVTGRINQSDLEKVCKQEQFSKKKFSKLYLSFTEDDVLWRIGVSFYIPDEPLQKIALKQAIEKYFVGKEIQEESVSSKYGTLHYYVVTMVDEKVSNMAIEKLVRSFSGQM